MRILISPRPSATETVLIALQNGVESDEQLAARFGRRRVLPAAVYVGATIEEPGVVGHAAPARISIGARQGFDDRRLEAVREVLAATGQQIQVSPDIQRERWRRLMWNASFNTVSAVTLRTPAELLAIPETRGNRCRGEACLTPTCSGEQSDSEGPETLDPRPLLIGQSSTCLPSACC